MGVGFDQAWRRGVVLCSLKQEDGNAEARAELGEVFPGEGAVHPVAEEMVLARAQAIQPVLRVCRAISLLPPPPPPRMVPRRPPPRPAVERPGARERDLPSRRR